jgi:hypothetical protein
VPQRPHSFESAGEGRISLLLHERQPGHGNSSFFLTLLCAGAAGQWYYGAHGIRSRQKRDIRGHHVDRTLLSRNDVWKWKEVEDSKSGDHALGTGGSVGAKKLVSWF